MKIEELKQIFNDAGVFVVPIIDSTDPDDRKGLQFDGELSQFIDVLHELKIKSVFVAVKSLSESFFEEEISIQSEGEDDYIPITELFPEIESFKAKIGEAQNYKVLAKAEYLDLNLFINEDWWVQLEEKLNAAYRAKSQKESIRTQELDKKFNAKKAKVIESIERLINDGKFIRLRTQGAMAEYAKINIENVLSCLEESELKKEIRKISDLLIAKGEK